VPFTLVLWELNQLNLMSNALKFPNNLTGAITASIINDDDLVAKAQLIEVIDHID
jgi:hypothetical protein